MFFDDYSRPKRIKRTPRLLDDFAQGIMCSIFAVLCVIFFRQTWQFALIFALCAAFRFWHHFKMQKNKAALRKIEKEYGDDEDDEDEDEDDEYETLSRKERKARFKEHLSQIEDEFPDIDLEDDEDD